MTISLRPFLPSDAPALARLFRDSVEILAEDDYTDDQRAAWASAADGAFQTLIDVLDGFGAFPAVIERELRRFLPFLGTTKVLMAAVRAGVGRETAHEVIKTHAVATALDLRESGRDDNDLLDRLAGDARLGLDAAALRDALGDPASYAGNASAQARTFVEQVAELARRHPDAATYEGAPVL